jgi:hypothetical protein
VNSSTPAAVEPRTITAKSFRSATLGEDLD